MEIDKKIIIRGETPSIRRKLNGTVYTTPFSSPIVLNLTVYNYSYYSSSSDEEIVEYYYVDTATLIKGVEPLATYMFIVYCAL